MLLGPALATSRVRSINYVKVGTVLLENSTVLMTSRYVCGCVSDLVYPDDCGQYSRCFPKHVEFIYSVT